MTRRAVLLEERGSIQQRSNQRVGFGRAALQYVDLTRRGLRTGYRLQIERCVLVPEQEREL